MKPTVTVCERSQELIAILKKFSEAYSMFADYMTKHYGEHRNRNEYTFEDDFYDKWCDVTDIVEKQLCDAMLHELRETKFTSI